MIGKESKRLDEFQKTSKEDWQAQLIKDLKGVTIEDALIKKDEIEELIIQSHFHFSDEKPLPETNYSSVRGLNTSNDWIIRQSIVGNSTKAKNSSALNRLNEGASGIGFSKLDDIKTTLKNVDTAYIYTDFEIENTSEAKQILAQLPEEKNTTFVFDPILEGNTTEIFAHYQETKQKNVKSFEINNTVFAAAGANISQQLGIALSQVNEYVNILFENGESVDSILNSLQIKLGIGNRFLLETAKFRAFRLLVENLAHNYDQNASATIQIHAQSLFLNKSLKDPYTNLLRLTTEGMSAAIGGVEIISLLPYDFYSEKGATDFSYHLCSNISTILKEESYFNIVTDAAGGAYAIEKLTSDLAQKAWLFFQEIEQRGGFIQALKSEFLTENIERIKAKRIQLFQEKKQKFIGLNCFPNPEKIDIEWKIPSKEKIVIEPLILEFYSEGGKS